MQRGAANYACVGPAIYAIVNHLLRVGRLRQNTSFHKGQ